MNKPVKFFLPEYALNDATVYYVDMVERGFISSGYTVHRVSKRSEIQRGDIVFFIELADYFKNLLFLLNVKIVFWFQGVVEEEYKMQHGPSYSLKEKFMFFRMRCYEKYLLKRASLIFFVSDALKEYLLQKYQIKGIKHSLIMPCYNKQLSKNAFVNQNRFDELSFVYAGSTHKWQCIDQVLKIYGEVEKKYPLARLTLLVKKNEHLVRTIESLGIQNITIKYVSLEELDNEFLNHKYGFIIRDEHIVNYVSTPTKMSSYLASALLPVYTDAVWSFKQNLKLDEFGLIFKPGNSEKFIAEKIIDHHNAGLSLDSWAQKLHQVFSSYYSDSFYINRIEKKLALITL